MKKKSLKRSFAKKKVIKHLKGDIKTFKSEAAEDRALIKSLTKKKSQKKDPKPKKITVAKGVKVKRGVESKMRSKPGSSSAGKYTNVSPKSFAGAAGGASEYSFPIPDMAHARNALARAHFAPNPEGIREKVYRMYPELKKRAMARKKKKD